MAISLQRAREMFDLVNARLCCPCSAAAPCIPFSYPDDGCWGRAHEMCRLMLAAGEQPKKVWIYGSGSLTLRVATKNHPGCEVRWNWHVAPTLEVSSGGVQTYVIDPALFNEPVPQATWKAAQNDPPATLVPTGPEVFHRSKGGSITLDPAYSASNGVLNTYRNELKLRCASAGGPPPYFACMVKGPGVQWFGSIPPNATQRWFTWGWPAGRHVFWTVMPLTPCPGGAQLAFDVAVERAGAADCTYWITVRNVTGDTVKFEGRYDVLSV